jgi:hypothetical protein
MWSVVLRRVKRVVDGARYSGEYSAPLNCPVMRVGAADAAQADRRAYSVAHARCPSALPGLLEHPIGQPTSKGRLITEAFEQLRIIVQNSDHHAP